MVLTYIIIGIGSVYTSILPNLIIDGIKEALRTSRGKTIYYCNSMTEMGETDGFSVQSHVNAIHRQLGYQFIDGVVYATDTVPEEVMARYHKENADQVHLDDSEVSYRLYPCSLLDFSSGMVRHDGARVRDSFIKILEEK
mgnify:CR=1 FL=1